MIDVKNSFIGGIDLDTSFYQLRRESYCDALNITRDATATNQDEIISNIVGNRLFTYSLPSGTNKCIGAFGNELRTTIIAFVYNSNSHNIIIEYNIATRTAVKVFECIVDSATDILNFSSTGKITSVNVYSQEEGDLLFFLDTLGRPTVLNITRFKNGEYTPVTRDIIDVAKTPPPNPPDAVYDNDTARRANNHRNKFYKFAQVFVFDDNEESTFSPQSEMPIPLRILDNAYTSVITNNNVITVSLNSGPQNVKAIRLLMSYVEKTNNWSPFATVRVIDKSTITLTSTQTSFASGSTTREIILFNGYVSIGTIIRIYLTLLPSTQTLVGTYTTVVGDTITSIYNGLSASITGIGIGTSPSVGGWGLYFDFNNTLYSFDEVEITILDTDVDNISFPFSFYNDSTYPTYDEARAIQLFDYVPLTAESQEMANGNTVEYAAITEGYDRDLVPNVVNTVSTVAAGTGGAVGSLNGVVTNTSNIFPFSVYKIEFTGVPGVGTIVTINLITTPGGVVTPIGTYTTLLGDVSSNVAAALAASLNSIGIATGVSSSGGTLFFRFTNSTYDFNSLVVTPPTVGVSVNSIATWLWSTERNIGIAYSDENGKSNGILYNAKITFPAYAENGSFIPLLPFINTKIYHVPPIWAYSYNFYFTKEPTTPLFWEVIDVVTTEADYLYFDVSNMTLNQTKDPTTAAVLSYTFSDGDRMRLIRRMSDNTVYADTYDAAILGQVTDPKINSVTTTGTFIKIRNIAPFNTVTYTSNFFIIEIYRPGQQTAGGTNDVYFELGREYPIIDPGTSVRVHGGQVTDQSTDYITPAEFNFYEGDTYFRSRSVVLSESGVGTFNVQDRNVVDFYISAVSSISGRPSVIDINAKETFFPAVIRFSQAVQPNTNINGLNRFFPENFIEADAAFGAIKRMKARDRSLEFFQYFRTGRSPLFSQIGKAPNGADVLLTTDILLNPVQYYLGDWGIGEAAASLAYFGYAIYFFDTTKGAILRLSRDGLTPISILYKVNSWATEQIPLRKNNEIIGAYDQKANNYVFTLGQPLNTLAIAGTILSTTYYATFSGIPAVGYEITIAVEFTVFRSYSYTVVEGDSIISIINSFVSLVNAGANFTAVRNGDALQITGVGIGTMTGSASFEYVEEDSITTRTFSELSNSFESRLSYIPEMMCTLGTLLCSWKDGQMWTHDNTRYNIFFGVDYESSITPVFNDKALIGKSYQSLDERANTKWDCPEIITQVNSYGTTPQQSNLVEADFSLLENKYCSSFLRDSNSIGGIINGDSLKGNWIKVKLRKQSASELVTLNMIEVYYTESPLNQR